MKLLFVTNMYPNKDHIYNGIHVKEQIEYLSKNYPIEHQIYFINGRASKLNYIKSILGISNLIRKENFDIIHIHFGLSGLFLLFNPFIITPILITLHGSDTNPNKSGGLLLKITMMVVNRVNKVIILNERMLSLFYKQSFKLNKIPCGINVKVFDSKRKNTKEVFRIGFPGDRKRPEKNFKLFKSITDSLIVENKNIEIIEFHNLTRNQVIENLSKLDCLLMTSLNEGSPQIIKEAMAGGIPIISTNVGDVQYLLSGVKNCYVIDSFDPDKFIIPLENLIALEAAQRVTNGKQRIEELQLDQDSVVSKIYDLYKEILNEKEN
ncbi:glycosyltransferase [Solitalea lacus]|uniref:glycosyltransferase n=1 Tax=Solitalea lacus TaxID=2911172 RepID=UPI001EDB35C6|nr:glycosyltransferase [Solitalea lacus]UKJ07070.1 glycosyltransferase [Solitalea lacus]